MKRRRPPYLQVVGTESEKIDHRPPYTTLDTIKVATAPLVDAVRWMTDAAIQAVEDGAADFGFPAGDTDTLREEVRAAVIRFSVGWIAERLAEHTRVCMATMSPVVDRVPDAVFGSVVNTVVLRVELSLRRQRQLGGLGDSCRLQPQRQPVSKDLRV